MLFVEQEIREFIIEKFLYGENNGKLSGDDSFMEQGIIDSTGVLELVGFIEGKYGIKIKNDELVPDNLDSINKLIRFIDGKRAQKLIPAHDLVDSFPR
jgi:acyl carrier protein